MFVLFKSQVNHAQKAQISQNYLVILKSCADGLMTTKPSNVLVGYINMALFWCDVVSYAAQLADVDIPFCYFRSSRHRYSTMGWAVKMNDPLHATMFVHLIALCIVFSRVINMKEGVQ